MPLAALLLFAIASSHASARTLEFQTPQVTGAGVAVSPDGRTLAFTLLGHLFSLPTEGGAATQLTFGPYYDDHPSFSPDGSQIAFTSDRDGSQGNIFVLNLATHQIVQLTHEEIAAADAWSPDGRFIAYLRYNSLTARQRRAVVARIPAHGGDPEILTPTPARMGQPFYLPSGQPAWTVIERDKSGKEISRIESSNPNGSTSTLKTIAGAVDRVVPTRSADGYYCRRITGAAGFNPGFEEILFVPSSDRPERQIAPVTRLGTFALAPDGRCLYFGDQGHLWKVHLPVGGNEALQFRAGVKLEVRDISQPSALSPGSNLPRAILTPRLSPDGRTLAFGAAGFLWLQPLDGKARRISQDNALESDPAFSPDGHLLGYVRSAYGKDSLRLLDLATARQRVLASGSGFAELAWSPDGKRLLAVTSGGFEQNIVAFNIADGAGERLAEAGMWSPRPQLAADGSALFYSADTTGIGNLYRLPLARDAKPEPLTRFTRHLSDARLSPDGKCVVFRRNHAILIASLSNGLAEDDAVRELAPEGGDSFALTSDGSSIIYAIGRRVWRQPLSGGVRQEIALHLDLPPAIAPPLLVRNARILDLHSGSFGEPTALLIRNGRIERIGDTAARNLPAGTTTLDAAGRFAIPGLFDLHVHSLGANTEAFLAYGVTSLRDTGGSLAALNAQQDRGDFTSLPLPRYFCSGEIFEGAQPYWGDGFLQIDNEADARAYVRQMKESGASFIKVYPSLSWPLKHVVADEAHRLGLPVVGHGTSPEEIIKSVILGFFSLEHNAGENRAFDDVIRMLAAAGTRWDPTVAVTGGDALLLRDEPERLADAKFLAFTPPWYLGFARAAGYYRTLSTAELRGAVSAELLSIGLARRAGVHLLIGTDAPNPEVFFGSSLHWEMERFVEAGFSPLETLRLATSAAAEAVGAPDLGVIQENKLADFVLLEANPLDDIRNTEKIWRVVKAGHLFDPDKLKKPAS